jgi:hypothetical protein
VATVKTTAKKRTQTKNSVPVLPDKSWVLRKSPRGVGFLSVPHFAQIPWLVHGFSTIAGGVSELRGKKILNLGLTEWDAKANVQENRRHFQSAIGADTFTLVPLKQIHSDVIVAFDAQARKIKTPKICSGDASITDIPNILLGVQTADCVPILLVDSVNRAVAAVHAGWRGTLQRILQKTIGRMEMEFGTRAIDLLVAIGPAIGGCCYEVGTEVAAAFLSQFPHAPDWFDELRTGDEPNPLQWLNQFPPGHQPPPKNVRLDLRQANRAQLLDSGVPAKNIFVSDLCTACRRDLLFSYRKDGAESGRMMAMIGIRPD